MLFILEKYWFILFIGVLLASKNTLDVENTPDVYRRAWNYESAELDMGNSRSSSFSIYQGIIIS